MVNVWRRLVKIRGFPILLGALALGLLLLTLPFGRTEKEMGSEYGGNMRETHAFSAYEEEIAHRIEQMTGALTGDMHASVLLTLDMTEETVYAKDNTVSGENQYTTKHLLSEGIPVATHTVLPKVRGIAVVCKGGDDPSVRLSLISMLTAAFDIPASRVYVGASHASIPDF